MAQAQTDLAGGQRHPSGSDRVLLRYRDVDRTGAILVQLSALPAAVTDYLLEASPAGSAKVSRSLQSMAEDLRRPSEGDPLR